MPDSAETRHPEFFGMVGRWRKARDFAAGVHAVKMAGETYLPKLALDSPEDYAEYKQRAVFFAGTTRALEGLTGALFADPPKTDVPDAMEPLLDTFAQDGSTLFEFAKRCAAEQLIVGRGGIVVDVDASRTHDPEPYAMLYPAEAIINWQTEVRAGREVLTLVVIEENITAPDPENRYSVKTSKQWRVWTLEELPRGPAARVQLVRKGADGKDETFVNRYPNRSGKPLDEIPFIFIGSVDTSASVDPVPIEGLVELNAAHYRLSADYYNSLHRIGCPTPYFFAEDAGKVQVKLGSSVALVSTDVNAKVGHLAISPTQVAALKEEMDNLVAKMAVLGARLLESQKATVEAADTLRLRQSGQTSVLENVALTLSGALTVALQWMAFWTGNDETKVSASVNREFFDSSLAAEMITAITGAYTGGTMSKATAVHNFAEGRLLPPDVTEEDELARIEAQAPAPALPVVVPPVVETTT